jgi:hypothetical protein
MTKKDLLAKTRKDLLDMAATRGIRGRSVMTKGDLVKAIMQAGPAREGRVRSKGGSRPAPRITPQAKNPQAKRQSAPVREKGLVRKTWREQQALIQRAKFEAKPEAPRRAGPQRPAGAATASGELPSSYGENRIVLLVRDPYWVHVYWEVSRDALLSARASLKDEWYDAKSVLRVHDVSGVDFDGSNSNSYFDISIEGGATNWYINTRVPNRSYCVEIGLLSSTGRFVLLARSNVAMTPRDAPSEVIDEKWMIPDWEFDKVYALSGGFKVGSSSLELKEMMEKALGGEMGSGAVGSLAISSPVGRPQARGFWFRVGTELIVYGATEPDAKVTLQGRPVKLNPDGTFSARFALPDGQQVIPAAAESKDGVDRRSITSIVNKKTEA